MKSFGKMVVHCEICGVDCSRQNNIIPLPYVGKFLCYDCGMKEYEKSKGIK